MADLAGDFAAGQEDEAAGSEAVEFRGDVVIAEREEVVSGGGIGVDGLLGIEDSVGPRGVGVNIAAEPYGIGERSVGAVYVDGFHRTAFPGRFRGCIAGMAGQFNQ
jgi:hypothetical protein